MHRCRYAYNITSTDLNCTWFIKNKLGVCAAWFRDSKVENSLLSANSLYKKIKKNPPKYRRVLIFNSKYFKLLKI